MKLFAMVGDRQVGPFELEDVVKQGVRPDTYVWCKGMPEWIQAREVPDICRYFRQRLSGTLPSQKNFSSESSSDQFMNDQEEQERLLSQLPPRMQNIVRKSGIKLTKENMPRPREHSVSPVLPILLYIICIILIVIGFFIL